MNPLEMLFAFREKAKAYGDISRNSLLQKYGLDPLSMQRAQLEQQGQIAAQQKAQQEGIDRQAYAKGASAWAKMNPNIGAGGSYVLSQMGDSPEMRAQAQAMMGAYGAQHAGPNAVQRQAMDFAAQQQPLTLEALRAQINASRASAANSQYSQFLAQQKAKNEAAFGNMPPAEFDRQVQQVRGLSEAIGGLTKVGQLVDDFSKLGRLASPEIRGRTAGMLASVIPAVQAMINNYGQNALGTEEREFITDLLGDPNKLMNMDSTTKARMDEILQRLKRDHQFALETKGDYIPPKAFEVPSYDLPPNLMYLGQMPTDQSAPTDMRGRPKGERQGFPGTYSGIPWHQ